MKRQRDEENPTVNISRWQYGLLNLIARSQPTIDQLRIIAGVSINSVLRHRWARPVAGRQGGAVRLIITLEGDRVRGQYQHAQPLERSHEMDLTERTRHYLGLSRLRVVGGRKVA